MGGNGRPSAGAVRLLSIQNPWDRPLQGRAAQPSTSSCCFHLRRRGKEKAQTQRSALLREASGQGRRPGGSQPQLTPTATQGCAEDAPATRCPPARQVPGAAPLWQGYGRRNKGHCSHQPPHQPLRRPQRPELPGGSSSLGGEAGRGREQRFGRKQTSKEQRSRWCELPLETPEERGSEWLREGSGGWDGRKWGHET